MGRKKGVSNTHDKYVLKHLVYTRIDDDTYETMLEMVEAFGYKSVSDYIRQAIDDKNRSDSERLYG